MALSIVELRHIRSYPLPSWHLSSWLRLVTLLRWPDPDSSHINDKLGYLDCSTCDKNNPKARGARSKLFEYPVIETSVL